MRFRLIILAIAIIVALITLRLVVEAAFPMIPLPTTSLSVAVKKMEIQLQPIAEGMVVEAIRTNYCLCKKCCGKNAELGQNRNVQFGRKATDPGGVAVDPRLIPYGTHVLFDDGEILIADDTGKAMEDSANRGGLQLDRRILIYGKDGVTIDLEASHKEAMRLGKDECLVKILEVSKPKTAKKQLQNRVF